MYNHNNRLIDINGQPYTWDDNGNLLETETSINAFDAADRLISSERTGSLNTQVQPIYNSVNDRVAQVVNGITTTFALDIQGLPEVIYTSKGNKYLHLPGVIATQNISNEWRYLLPDGLGSIRYVTSETGTIISTQDFDPYGNPLRANQEQYGFTGEWWENDIGLLHLRARWYEPEIGIFLSKDSFEGIASSPTTQNGYVYAHQNPINLTDPTGMSPIDPIAQALLEKTEACYQAGDLDCVWYNYYIMALGGMLTGHPYASANLGNFLFKGGDREYGPYTNYTRWFISHESVQDSKNELAKRILSTIYSQAKQGNLIGKVQDETSVIPNNYQEPDLYYAMNQIELSVKADYIVEQNPLCSYWVWVDYKFSYFDKYDWHKGLGAQSLTFARLATAVGFTGEVLAGASAELCSMENTIQFPKHNVGIRWAK